MLADLKYKYDALESQAKWLLKNNAIALLCLVVMLIVTGKNMFLALARTLVIFVFSLISVYGLNCAAGKGECDSYAWFVVYLNTFFLVLNIIGTTGLVYMSKQGLLPKPLVCKPSKD